MCFYIVVSVQKRLIIKFDYYESEMPRLKINTQLAEVRRANLELLIEAYETIAQLNKVLGKPRTDSSLSQIRNRTVNTVNHCSRRMGSKFAREIEKKLSLPVNWMDIEHPEGSSEIEVLNVPFSENSDDLGISISEIEHPERELARLGNKFLSFISNDIRPAGLRFFEVENDDFADIPRNSIVIIDNDTKTYKNPGVYLLEAFGERRLVKIRRGLDGNYILSQADDVQETMASLEEISIVGRAVYLWKVDILTDLIGDSLLCRKQKIYFRSLRWVPAAGRRFSCEKVDSLELCSLERAPHRL